MTARVETTPIRLDALRAALMDFRSLKAEAA